MLLIVWMTLSTTGLAAFLLGHLLGFHGIASIGAVMVMLTGGELILEDLEVKDGETIEHSVTTVGNQAIVNETVVNDTYRDHSWVSQFASDNAIGLGVFEVLIGALLFYQEMLAMSEG